MNETGRLGVISRLEATAAIAAALVGLTGASLMGCAKRSAEPATGAVSEKRGEIAATGTVASAAEDRGGAPEAPPTARTPAVAPGPVSPAAPPPAVGALGAGPGGGGRTSVARKSAMLLDDGAPAAPRGFGVGPQFAGVRAGEWDDNANFREFTKFLASAPTNHRRLDLQDRRFLVVRDKDGRGVPRCRVTVRDRRQASTSLVTTASGRAILFPRAEGLGGDELTATATCGEGSTEASFALREQEDGVVDLRLASERAPLGTRVIDVAFVLDTTGSMSEEITAVKSTIQKVAKVLSDEQTTVRIGLVEYKDRSDAFVKKVYPFATDLPAFAARVSRIEASGGGDMPEDMNAGLHAAVHELSWSDRSVARLAFVIADAPPHLDYQDGPDYAADTRAAARRGIQLFTVAASGMDALGQVVFRQMAQYTGGTNMFVLRGGAGPQSTGGGDPISSCGGTHTNYSSGKLDELIVQKIRRELRALDADPMRIAGLGTDENAKPCEQRVVLADLARP